MSEHRRAIERISAHTLERDTGDAIKQVDGKEVRVLSAAVVPHRKLRVIAELVWVGLVHLQGIEEIGTRRVTGLRDCYALIERTGAGEINESEIAYHPAVGLMIIENKRISLVLARAARGASTQRGEQRIERGGGSERGAGFVINSERRVERFDVMIRADISNGVGRQTTASSLRRVHSIKRQHRAWHRGYRR
jgi:hypothetical protein